jgi:A/G-specific adenine glycosylase
MAATPASKSSPIQRRLFAWFDRNQRDLPWRRTADPYTIWLSEIMLQQTQVATVIPYYERFRQRFPTVRRLATAPTGEVLKFWAGLGYYARARNLHRAARQVVTQHGGRLPRTVQELAALPGIGRYTAGAIASIAFGARAAVVDGNVTRVLARLFDVRADVGKSSTKAKLWSLAESLLPVRRCGDFNQALMELGATVCLPGQAARCDVCPLASSCQARRAGTVAARPVKRGKAALRRETHVVVAIRRVDGRDRVKYLFVRRPDRGLWGGLWELPSAPVTGRTAADAARGLIESAVGARAGGGTGRPFCRIEHVLSHRRIRMIGYEFAAPIRGRTAAGRLGRWVALDVAERLGVSRAMRRMIDALRDRGCR